MCLFQTDRNFKKTKKKKQGRNERPHTIIAGLVAHAKTKVKPKPPVQK